MNSYKASLTTKGLIGAACLAIMAMVPGTASADEHSKMPAILSDKAVMSEVVLPDFSYAGYEYGQAEIPHVSAVIDVADYGAVPNDNRDDSAALIAAIAAASEHEGPVRVQLGKGRYQLTEILWITSSDIVLAGMGMGEGGTEIYMPRPLNQIDDGGALDEVREYMVVNEKIVKNEALNLDRLFSEYSWSGGFIWVRAPNNRPAEFIERFDPVPNPTANILAGEQFTRTMTVDDTSKLSVGDVVRVNWYNRAGPDGPLLKSMYGDTDVGIGAAHWETPERPVVQQRTRIEAISGRTVTIADPLLHPITNEIPANFEGWNHISNVGIQDIAFVFPESPYFGHHNEAGFNAMYLTSIHNGWVQNVRVHGADSSILSDDSANLTIRNVITEGNLRAHYAIHVSRSHNVLVENVNAFNEAQHTFSFNTATTRSVFKEVVGWKDPALDQHAGSNHQNLFDNVTVHVIPDRKASDGAHMDEIYRGGGAPEWQPGHGRYNTTWNLNVVVDSGVPAGQPIVLQGRSEGPDARIVGIHSNRPVRLEYTPAPYTEMIGEPVRSVPSLYDYQLTKRLSE